jgi:hypothetical protein
VLLISLEQNTGEIGMQAVARYSRLTLERIELARKGEAPPFTDAESDALERAKEKLRATEFFLRVHGAERHGRRLNDVMASALRGTFDAVFLDHVGLVGGRELGDIEQTLNRLRALTRGEERTDYQPFVCCTSPLNRDSYAEDTLPSMSHFRGSSFIESDCDVAMILRKRKRPTEDESEAPDVVDGFVLKNRQGRSPLILQFEANGAICFVNERHKSEAPPQHWSQREPGEEG